MGPDGSAVKDALPKDMGSIPRAHSKQQVTTFYNSSSRELTPSSDTSTSGAQTHIQSKHPYTK